VGGRAWAWGLNLAQLLRLRAAFRASPLFWFARVGPVGVCVRARVGIARQWKSTFMLASRGVTTLTNAVCALLGLNVSRPGNLNHPPEFLDYLSGNF